MLNSTLISRVRRNHGLEHATIHVLTARYPRTMFVGRSDFSGFYLLGDVPGEAVAQAAREALERLRAGERRLAIHPNCGTNLLTASLLAGTAAYMTISGSPFRGWRDRFDRLPMAILATLVGLIVAQPLGMFFQYRLTTEGNPRGLEILSVRSWQSGATRLHRIRTYG
ncbi:MAG TPA: DUF6391 domain-containing protein [Anaerolineales bacterium]|nr:DUF6391 domain-containing protein [Anaerolineales bacterium]